MTGQPAADAADARLCVEHHLEEACTCCWQAHPGKTLPDLTAPEHADDGSKEA